MLGDKKLAPLAAEAIATITGLPIAKQFAKPSTPWSPEGKDEEKDEPFGPAADLPKPEPVAIEEWWRREEQKFDPRHRYFRGRPWSPDVLLKELETGPARRRAGLALDAAVRSSGAHCLSRRRPHRSAARGTLCGPRSTISTLGLFKLQDGGSVRPRHPSKSDRSVHQSVDFRSKLGLRRQSCCGMRTRPSL